VPVHTHTNEQYVYTHTQYLNPKPETRNPINIGVFKGRITSASTSANRGRLLVRYEDNDEEEFSLGQLARYLGFRV
jgi:hypothetical protein